MTGVARSSRVDERLFGASQLHVVSDLRILHRPTRAITTKHNRRALEGQTPKTHRRDIQLRQLLRPMDQSWKTIAWTLSSIR
jgi:hypothetical protein